MKTSDQVFSITALTVYIRHLFDQDMLLQDVWVEGEVSNFSRPASGHWYFTLKDNTSQLKAVMWRSAASRQTYQPDHGEKVRIHGKVSVYEASGQYQLYCDVILPVAKVGDLHAQFREAWDRLEAEGLFSPDLKRPLPPFPRRIGIVTSLSTAAFQDIQNVMRRRYPLAEIIVSQTPVQGNDAPPQIVKALQAVDAFGVDVILLGRGGGSLEDLWCFNDERIARAIRRTRAPVVTGVGHETDTTLVDGAADLRAPTPSAGAELITPSSDDLRTSLHRLAWRLTDAVRDTVEVRRGELSEAAHKLRLVSPIARVRNERQRVDELAMRLSNAVDMRLAALRASLSAESRALELANPRHLLARGYALVTRADEDRPLTDAAEVAPGTVLHIRLSKGSVVATVVE